MNFRLRATEKQLPEGTEAPDRPEHGHSGSRRHELTAGCKPKWARAGSGTIRDVGRSLIRGPAGQHIGWADTPGGCNRPAGPCRYKPSIAE